MAIWKQLAANNEQIASAAGITVYQPAAAVDPSDITAQFASASDEIANTNAQVALKRANARAQVAATAAASRAATDSANLAAAAQQHVSDRQASLNKLSIAARNAGSAAGLKAGQSAFAAAERQSEAAIAAAPAIKVPTSVRVGSVKAPKSGKASVAAAGASGAVTGGVTGARAKALSLAQSYVGKTPYVFGGVSRKGIDCSGLVMAVYSQLGYKIPMHSATWQGRNIPGTRVPWGSKAAKPGDLVAWKNGSHIAIYAGGGNIIEAAHPGTNVRVHTLWASPSAVTVIHLNL